MGIPCHEKEYSINGYEEKIYPSPRLAPPWWDTVLRSGSIGILLPLDPLANLHNGGSTQNKQDSPISLHVAASLNGRH